MAEAKTLPTGRQGLFPGFYMAIACNRTVTDYLPALTKLILLYMK
jgi:hypothetical protein